MRPIIVVLLCFALLIKHTINTNILDNEHQSHSIATNKHKRDGDNSNANKDVQTGDTNSDNSEDRNKPISSGESNESIVDMSEVKDTDATQTNDSGGDSDTSNKDVKYKNESEVNSDSGIPSTSNNTNTTATIPVDLDFEDKKRHDLIFNVNNLAPWQTGYLNRSTVEEKCNSSGPCWASDEVVPLCGTDNQTYLNPGVFGCAQQCDETLKIAETGFGPCSGHKFPANASAPAQKVVKSPHMSSNARIKVDRTTLSVLKWLGFHVHNDGSFYLADEHTYNTWWNVK